MKILILGPLDYPSAHTDLVLLNYNQGIYSSLYLFDILYGDSVRKGNKINETALMIYLAGQMTQKEYEKFDLFFGVVPKKFDFDYIICYNKEVLSIQEGLLTLAYPDFPEMAYTTSEEKVIFVDNIMEAIKFAQSKTTASS